MRCVILLLLLICNNRVGLRVRGKKKSENHILDRDCFSRRLTGFEYVTILDRDCFSRRLTGFEYVTILDRDCFSRRLTGFESVTILDRDCFSRRLTGFESVTIFYIRHSTAPAAVHNDVK
jgi:hypothetical protein